MDISEDKLEEMLARASHNGAIQALTELGLDDENAVQDIKSLRELLSAFRSAKSTAWKSLVSALTHGLLVVIILGLLLFIKQH